MSFVPVVLFKKQPDVPAHFERSSSGDDMKAADNASPRPLPPTEPIKKQGNAPLRALIVGSGTVGCALADKLEASGRYDIVGFADDEIDPFGGKNWPVLGPRHAASELAAKWQVDEIFLAYAPTWQQQLMEELSQTKSKARVRVVPSFYDAMVRTGKIRSIGEVAVLDVSDGQKQRGFDHLKRGLDVCVALVGLLVMLPLMVLVAALICLTSPGPVLFKQERTGINGKPFTLFKFRTMRLDAETKTGPVLSKGKKDGRLTPIGYYLRLVRLDELPQLINVLKGEMSMVGPRPERPHFVAQFEARNPVYARRHQVRPGITGLAQVHGGYHTDARDKLRFDLFYVSHRSLWLDFSIVMQTVLAVTIRPTGR